VPTSTTIIGQATRIFAFPDLDVIPIADFTPGLVVGADYGMEFSSSAPLGSCSQAYRCYGRPNVGLEPLPTYTQYYTRSTNGTGYTLLTLADLKLIPNVPSYPSTQTTPMDLVVASWTVLNQSANLFAFAVDMYGSSAYNVAPTYMQIYTNNAAYSNIASEVWPNLVRGWTSNGSNSVPTFMSHVPSITASNSLLLTNNPGNTGPTTVPIAASPPVLSAYSGGRFIAMASPPLLVIGPGFASGPMDFFTSDINAITNFVGSEYFYPESCSTVASWGSMSVGEFWYVMASGGAVSINGDIQNPTSATNLPGVQSAGNAIGEAIPTPLGLVYCTDNEGVWTWNGGNTATKLSMNMPDNIWLRTPPTVPLVGGLATVNTGPNYRNGLWGDWMLFAGNWMLDTFTGAWWQIENPLTVNMQVWCGSQPGAANFFYSSPGMAQNAAGNSTVPIYLWDKNKLANNWTWVSNPIPSPGSGVTYLAVEICASNMTGQPATITITPSSPPGRRPYANQIIPAPPTVFTIPPLTAGYRKAYAVGWDDYNICVNVTATAFSPSLQAPVLHELNLGYKMRAA